MKSMQVTSEAGQTISILAATPTFNSMMYNCFSISMKNLQMACREKGIQFEHSYTYNESLITRARNTLCDILVNDKKYTHLLFIDADIEFETDDIFKMLEFNQPIVGGSYPKKNLKWDKIAEFVNQNHESIVTAEELKNISRDIVYIALNEDDINVNGDFVEVQYTGTGIMLIQRQVLEKMQEANPDDNYTVNNQNFFRFFDVGLKWIDSISKNIYLSEDYWFCERWRELGGKIFLYTKFRCKHCGSMAY